MPTGPVEFAVSLSKQQPLALHHGSWQILVFCRIHNRVRSWKSLVTLQGKQVPSDGTVVGFLSLVSKTGIGGGAGTSRATTCFHS